MTFKIVVCASGGGGNFRAICEAQENIGFKVERLIVDRRCGAIDVAYDFGIKTICLQKKSPDFFEDLDKFIPHDTDLIFLAGFFPIINRFLVNKWNKRIINTHPSLLPRYGGIGMYGVKVQQAVMRNKEKYAGCTIHYVSEEVDQGDIILQEKILVDYNLTPWELGGKVFKKENKLVVKAISKLMSNDKK